MESDPDWPAVLVPWYHPGQRSNVWLPLLAIKSTVGAEVGWPQATDFRLKSCKDWAGLSGRVLYVAMTPADDFYFDNRQWSSVPEREEHWQYVKNNPNKLRRGQHAIKSGLMQCAAHQRASPQDWVLLATETGERVERTLDFVPDTWILAWNSRKDALLHKEGISTARKWSMQINT